MTRDGKKFVRQPARTRPNFLPLTIHLTGPHTTDKPRSLQSIPYSTPHRTPSFPIAIHFVQVWARPGSSQPDATTTQFERVQPLSKRGPQL